MVLIEVKEELVGCSRWEWPWERREEIHQGRRAIQPQSGEAQVSRGMATVPASMPSTFWMEAVEYQCPSSAPTPGKYH